MLKKEQACADAIGNTETSEMLQGKLNRKYDEINKWCDEQNLKRDYSRELVQEQLKPKNSFTPSQNDSIINNKAPLELNIQLFAKKSSDFETVILPKKEFGKVMHEIATSISKEQMRKQVFSKCIGDYVYTVENNGFGNYRIIDKEKIN